MPTGSADERSALALALKAAGRGGAAERARVQASAQQYGEHGVKNGASLAALIVELDEMESNLLSNGAQATETHELCAAARRTVVASFTRIARHDIVNAMGAVRNALLLIDEGAEGADRQRF